MASLSLSVCQMPTLRQLEPSPVKGLAYERYLARRLKIDKLDAARFFSQWFAFSSAIPEILSIAAMKAESHEERTNILANLFSEMGFDSDGQSHAELLKDLIAKATGHEPIRSLIEQETFDFLKRLKMRMLEGSAAFNAGLILELEAVAYDILDVLNEILQKCGRGDLTAHPYIVIHETIEANHIDCTERNKTLHAENENDIKRGEAAMKSEWKKFWNHAYTLLVTSRV